MVHFLGFDYKAACGLAWPLLFLDVYGEKRYTIYVLYSLIFPRSYPRARCYRARGFSFPPWPPGKRINLRAAAFSRAIAIYSFSNAYRCLSDTAACCGTLPEDEEILRLKAQEQALANAETAMDEAPPAAEKEQKAINKKKKKKEKSE